MAKLICIMYISEFAINTDFLYLKKKKKKDQILERKCTKV